MSLNSFRAKKQQASAQAVVDPVGSVAKDWGVLGSVIGDEQLPGWQRYISNRAAQSPQQHRPQDRFQGIEPWSLTEQTTLIDVLADPSLREDLSVLPKHILSSPELVPVLGQLLSRASEFVVEGSQWSRSLVGFVYTSLQKWRKCRLEGYEVRLDAVTSSAPIHPPHGTQHIVGSSSSSSSSSVLSVPTQAVQHSDVVECGEVEPSLRSDTAVAESTSSQLESYLASPTTSRVGSSNCSSSQPVPESAPVAQVSQPVDDATWFRDTGDLVQAMALHHFQRHQYHLGCYEYCKKALELREQCFSMFEQIRHASEGRHQLQSN
jgi:hypothetical protein